MLQNSFLPTSKRIRIKNLGIDLVVCIWPCIPETFVEAQVDLSYRVGAVREHLIIAGRNSLFCRCEQIKISNGIKAAVALGREQEEIKHQQPSPGQ